MGVRASTGSNMAGSDSKYFIMLLRIKPAATALTRMPWSAQAIASVLVSCTMPALAAP